MIYRTFIFSIAISTLAPNACFAAKKLYCIRGENGPIAEIDLRSGNVLRESMREKEKLQHPYRPTTKIEDTPDGQDYLIGQNTPKLHVRLTSYLNEKQERKGVRIQVANKNAPTKLYEGTLETIYCQSQDCPGAVKKFELDVRYQRLSDSSFFNFKTNEDFVSLWGYEGGGLMVSYLFTQHYRYGKSGWEIFRTGEGPVTIPPKT